VVLGREGEIGASYDPAVEPETVERLGRGHLVNEVEIDEEEIGLTLGAADDVLVPDFFRKRSTHIHFLPASFHILNAPSSGA
jgi:hypothetical protein